jgi:acetyl esterase/lipase
VRWVRAHAKRLGVDPRRIGIFGSSSGAQLVLLVGLKPGTPEHATTPIVVANGSLDHSPGDDSVSFVVALYPVADPLARYQYALSRENEAPDPSGFDAKRLIASHRAYFKDEAAMAEASVTRLVSVREAKKLPPVWLAQPEHDDNVPAAITEAFVRAYRTAGGALEHVHFPGARHGFIQKASPDFDTCITHVRDFIGRQIRTA